MLPPTHRLTPNAMNVGTDLLLCFHLERELGITPNMLLVIDCLRFAVRETVCFTMSI